MAPTPIVFWSYPGYPLLPDRLLATAFIAWIGAASLPEATPISAHPLRIERPDASDSPEVVLLQLAQPVRTHMVAVENQHTRWPVQALPDGRTALLVPPSPRAGLQVLDLEPGTPGNSPAAELEAIHEPGRVIVRAFGRTVLVYQEGPGELPNTNIPPIFRRGGYLHPIFTPRGRSITDDYPTNHLHHHGLWTAWTRTEFEGRRPDFWNMGQGSGTVRWTATERLWSGPVVAGFSARHEYVDLSGGEPVVALRERWEIQLHRPAGDPPAEFIFDLTLTQDCATPAPLRLPRYHYGGLGFRGHRAWDGAEHVNFLTSEGETNRVRGNETRGRWCYIGGALGEQTGGVAILCHPDNPRAPQPMRLHPSEPFFCFAPPQLGDWEISPGQPMNARYRFVIFDGPPDRRTLENHWQRFARPPRLLTR